MFKDGGINSVEKPLESSTLVKSANLKSMVYITVLVIFLFTNKYRI